MNPVIKTRHGKVRGSAANGVNTFKGIRFLVLVGHSTGKAQFLRL
jgi:carboxylesterase type B